MEFKEKQYDGLYEVSELEFHIQNQFFKAILFFPPEFVQKPLNDLDLVIINNMSHDVFQDDCDVKINEEIKKSFSLNY
jgi:hypothetical protein